MKKYLSELLLAGLLVTLGLVTQHRAYPAVVSGAFASPSHSPAPKGFVYVAKAVDGDTIELQDGTKIRYLGMDTPETVHPKKPVQCYGHEASDRNRELVQDHYVRLVRDIEDADKYGRLLRYVYLQDGTFVNLALVTDGYARVYTWPPNIAHTKEFVLAQKEAKTAGLGLWSACR